MLLLAQPFETQYVSGWSSCTLLSPCFSSIRSQSCPPRRRRVGKLITYDVLCFYNGQSKSVSTDCYNLDDTPKDGWLSTVKKCAVKWVLVLVNCCRIWSIYCRCVSTELSGMPVYILVIDCPFIDKNGSYIVWIPNRKWVGCTACDRQGEFASIFEID